jgi:glycosyltransferase involved in cell wall biosynthesis
MSNYKHQFSVLMITFNHELFIIKALDSIICQDFKYSYEIVIGIDKSTDKTALLCKEYKESHPNIDIVLLESHENIGMYRNFYKTLKSCSGKYIAILEGDDYWTDLQKMSKQFRFFEENPGCILSGSLASVVDRHGNQIEKTRINWFGKGIRYTLEDLVLANRFTTLTVAFRAERINWDKLKKLKDAPHIDWPFNELMGAYRKHEGGIYSQIGLDKKLINTAHTVYAIKTIVHRLDFKWYLSSLHTNLIKKYSKNLDEKNLHLYEPHLVIYKGGWIKWVFLKSLFKTALLFLMKGELYLFRFKSKIELIRQTKTSIKNYIQILINPVLILAALKLFFKRNHD